MNYLTQNKAAVQWCRDIGKPHPGPQKQHAHTDVTLARVLFLYWWAGTGFIFGSAPQTSKAPETVKGQDRDGRALFPGNVAPAIALTHHLHKSEQCPTPDNSVSDSVMSLAVEPLIAR